MAHPDVFVPRRRRGVRFDAEQLAHYSGEPVAGIVNSTLLGDPDAAGAVAAVSTDIRLVAILRNPIDRAYSWYLKRTRDGDGIYSAAVTFEAALEQDPAVVDGGRYHVGLEAYFGTFERSQLLVLDFDGLSADAAGFIRAVYAFIGADPGYSPPQLERKSNYSAAVRSNLLHQTMRRGKRVLWRVTREDGPLVSRLESSSFVRRLRRLNEENSETMSSDTRSRLADVFAADNARLEELLGWDLRHWA
jgi:hypothetical protein